jgi:hypothetical protein
MTPSELRAYLQAHGEVSMTDLSVHFDADAGVVEDVLAYWQRKGKIGVTTTECGKACACGCGSMVFYRWLNPPADEAQ